MISICETCKKGDGSVGKVAAFKTQYGFRMHMQKVHGLISKDGKWRKVRR